MPRKINYDNWSKEELIKELKRIKEIKYGLVWHRDLPEEKIDTLINPDARTPNEMFPNEMAGKPFPILKEVKVKEINGDKSKPVNLLIEGDNYHSLAVLNFTHQETVDLIYIDPPYNTGGGDFVYRDNFSSGYVRKDDPFRHSKWLSFMEKRLKLAKNLLKKTGVIFISIDDNEVAQLRLLCDEIFEESNFITTLIWKKKGTSTNVEGAHISELTEYVLCYGKSAEAKLNPRIRAKETREYPFSDKEGKYRTAIIEKKNVGSYTRASMLFKILGRSPRAGKRWQIGEEKARELEKKKRFIIERGIIKLKIYDFEDRDTVSAQPNLLEDCGSTQSAQFVLDEIIGQKGKFDNPKPKELIQKLMTLVGNGDSTILDFMAGSGTTGQAVLELNKEDSGNRQFILCTNNENNICTDVCYPRLKKVIKGYKNGKNENVAGLGGNLKYYSCDFVEAEPTDRNKRKLVSESTEMLCIREDAFELVQDGSDFKIFKNNDKYLGIVFYEEAIEDFKKAIKKINGHFSTYVFSLGDDPHEKQFTDVKSRVTLCAIPEVILKVYREIFK